MKLRPLRNSIKANHCTERNSISLVDSVLLSFWQRKPFRHFKLTLNLVTSQFYNIKMFIVKYSVDFYILLLKKEKRDMHTKDGWFTWQLRACWPVPAIVLIELTDLVWTTSPVPFLIRPFVYNWKVKNRYDKRKSSLFVCYRLALEYHDIFGHPNLNVGSTLYSETSYTQMKTTV